MTDGRLPIFPNGKIDRSVYFLVSDETKSEIPYGNRSIGDCCSRRNLQSGTSGAYGGFEEESIRTQEQSSAGPRCHLDPRNKTERSNERHASEMIIANQLTSLDAAMTLRSHVVAHQRDASEFHC
jgi:hypothetical protein